MHAQHCLAGIRQRPRTPIQGIFAVIVAYYATLAGGWKNPSIAVWSHVYMP